MRPKVLHFSQFLGDSDAAGPLIHYKSLAFMPH